MASRIRQEKRGLRASQVRLKKAARIFSNVGAMDLKGRALRPGEEGGVRPMAPGGYLFGVGPRASSPRNILCAPQTTIEDLRGTISVS